MMVEGGGRCWGAKIEKLSQVVCDNGLDWGAGVESLLQGVILPSQQALDVGKYQQYILAFQLPFPSILYKQYHEIISDKATAKIFRINVNVVIFRGASDGGCIILCPHTLTASRC